MIHRPDELSLASGLPDQGIHSAPLLGSLVELSASVVLALLQGSNDLVHAGVHLLGHGCQGVVESLTLSATDGPAVSDLDRKLEDHTLRRCRYPLQQHHGLREALESYQEAPGALAHLGRFYGPCRPKKAPVLFQAIEAVAWVSGRHRARLGVALIAGSVGEVVAATHQTSPFLGALSL